VTLIRHQLELKNIELEVKLAETPPLLGDIAQLQQVILVILVNATDAMPQGDAYVDQETDDTGPDPHPRQ
jgi:signal transduction histidine kinase